MSKQADDNTAPDIESANTSPFQRALKSVISVGRELLDKQRTSPALVRGSAASLSALCKDLIDHRGEASGLALAEEIAEASALMTFCPPTVRLRRSTRKMLLPAMGLGPVAPSLSLRK